MTDKNQPICQFYGTYVTVKQYNILIERRLYEEVRENLQKPENLQKILASIEEVANKLIHFIKEADPSQEHIF